MNDTHVPPTHMAPPPRASPLPGYAPNPVTVQRPLKCWVSALALAHEWHEVLARRDLLRSAEGRSGAIGSNAGSTRGVISAGGGGGGSGGSAAFVTKYWRWNGWLCR
jgi:hypothetical protein